MVSALRLLTLGFLAVAVLGLRLMICNAGPVPPSELVVDCLSGDFEVPVWEIESRSSVVRPALIDGSVRIEAISIIDGPAIPE